MSLRSTRFGSFALLAGLGLIVTAGGATSTTTAPPPAIAQETSVGSSFSYQGELKNASGPVQGTCAFQFVLFDAPSGGAQVGTALNQSVQVVDGLFTVQLDFGAGAFDGTSHWLQVAVQCAGDSVPTVLAPRQQLTAVPYALSLMPGATIRGAAPVALTVENTGAGARQGSFAAAVQAIAAANGTGVASRSPAGVAVQGESITGTGVLGRSPTAVGVQGESITGTGVLGRSPTAVGVQGESITGTGVLGRSPTAVGVQGESTTGTAVFALSVDGVGVEGRSTTGGGVQGRSTNSFGVGGTSTNADGIVGSSGGGDSNAGVYGENTGGGFAGWFEGKTHVNGTLSKAAGSFKIDHPLDPANRYLSHSFVESPDMKNLYDGIVTTDGAGEAVVELPAYFAALNRDFRYQLTVIGTFAQAIIASEIADNRFTIKTDRPGVRVSWQVTGIRQDAYANAHPIEVEQDKPAAERGSYLHPAELGQPISKGLSYRARQASRANRQIAAPQPGYVPASNGR
jgi:hypothetical protein